MLGYTEVLQTIGAMMIFGIILMSSNRMIQRNNIMQVEGELEQETIALAQDIIEEARIKDFDEETVDGLLPPTKIPGSFTSPSTLGPEGESGRTNFDDFDDYNGYIETVPTAERGEFVISAEVFYVKSTSFDTSATPTTFKKIRVSITNDLLVNASDEIKQYKFEFIRNYYAD